MDICFYTRTQVKKHVVVFCLPNTSSTCDRQLELILDLTPRDESYNIDFRSTFNGFRLSKGSVVIGKVHSCTTPAHQ